MEIKFLQTSDWHLGTKLSSFDQDFANFRRETAYTALRKIIATALDENVKLILLPGDLFNSENPSSAIKSKLLEILKQIPNDMKIFILPGTHDFYIPKGLWDTSVFATAVVFKDKGFSSFCLDEFGICVWGVPVTGSERDKNWLENPPEVDKSKTNILLYHGDYRGLGREYDVWDYPFTFDDIKKTPFEYIALGHHHAAKTIEIKGRTIAAYAGSPVGWSFRKSEMGDRNYIIGEIKNGQVKIDFRRVDTPIIRNFEINTSKTSETSSFLDEISKCSKDDIIRIRVSGVDDPLNFKAILDDPKVKFKWLMVDESGESDEWIDPANNFHLKSLFESIDKELADGKINQEFCDRAKKRAIELFSK
jgi:exonuclease SbcD